jgi:hypothetical protein
MFITYFKAIGISVEFSAHIARAFAISNANTRKDKAVEALQSMGPPVILTSSNLLIIKFKI